MEKAFYDHQKVELKWKKRWEETELYTIDPSNTKEKYYCLDMFPYPSAYNLHVGHWRGYVLSDFYARYEMLKGKNVLHPMGFDAFGLNAENAAIKYKSHPNKFTQEAITTMLRQFKEMGSSFDWSKYLSTSEKGYYRWTQWLFLQLYNHGLAEKRLSEVNWCPNDKTVLANEQVVNGCCERCGTTVTKKTLSQWYLKTTEFSQELLDGLDGVNWPERTKTLQRNWIGKSIGTSVIFPVGDKKNIEVFTTRVDTIFGVTALILAPEHPLIREITTKEALKSVEEYITQSKSKTNIDREQNKEKTAVFTGAYAKHPLTNEDTPVWVADYVLMSYGTGAVMAVPAHDERDYEFAVKYKLPIKKVIIPKIIDTKNPHQEGKKNVFRKAVIALVRDPKTNKYLVQRWKKQNWTTFVMGGIEDGESPEEAAKREIKEETGYKNVKLVKTFDGPIHNEFFAAHKDVNRTAWTWQVLLELENNEQDPIASEEKDICDLEWVSEDYLTPENFTHSEMPHILAEMKNGSTPLFTDYGVLINSGDYDKLSSKDAQVRIVSELGAKKLGSPKTTFRLRDWLVSRQRYWGAPIPIVYDPEGREHAVKEERLPLELPNDVDFLPGGESPIARSRQYSELAEKLYGKGWHFDTDTLDTFVDSSWYYLRYLTPGDQAQAFDKDLVNKWLPVDLYIGGIEHATLHLLYARFITKFLARFDYIDSKITEPFSQLFNIGMITMHGSKMSKSKGNVVNPDLIIEHYGTDALRGYELFIGPLDVEAEWSNNGINGIHRFLLKLYQFYVNSGVTDEANSDAKVALSTYLSAIEPMIKDFRLNTVISEAMKLLGNAAFSNAGKSDKEAFLITLSPIFPFICEELWEVLGHKESIFKSHWPEVGEYKVVPEISVLINQKYVATVSTDETNEDKVVELAKSLPEVRAKLGTKSAKVIYRIGKLVNFIVAA